MVWSAAGLIHISHLVVGGRVTDPNEAIKRSQVVKVKVLSVAGTRISLSLKEVDQRTGEDLAPRSSRPDDVRSTPRGRVAVSAQWPVKANLVCLGRTGASGLVSSLRSRIPATRTVPTSLAHRRSCARTTR